MAETVHILAATGCVAPQQCTWVDIIIHSSQNVLTPNGMKVLCELDSQINQYGGGTPGCSTYGCMKQCPGFSLASFMTRISAKDCNELDHADITMLGYAVESCLFCKPKFGVESCQVSGLPCSEVLAGAAFLIAQDGDIATMSSPTTRMLRCLPSIHAKGIGAATVYAEGLRIEILEPAVKYGYGTQTGLDDSPEFDVAFMSNEMIELAERAALLFDLHLLMVAAAATFIIILAHTRSLFVTVLSILQIASAFPCAYVVYTSQAFLGITWFPLLNYLSCFILVAIGADDLFVFVDAWRQSRALLPEGATLPQQLSWAHGRASKVSSRFVYIPCTPSCFFVS